VKPTSTGYVYWVEDEHLRVFANLSPERRFEWVDGAREFLVAAATPETRERILRLRRGESIVDVEPSR